CFMRHMLAGSTIHCKHNRPPVVQRFPKCRYAVKTGVLKSEVQCPRHPVMSENGKENVPTTSI
ncbi:hypothetical protein, partial [Burkholderia ubonensis]|uniref:hypothetical protein n=1 Tax=Burkholderia ubonensis TaxID=101571 RepID=UPI001E353EF6